MPSMRTRISIAWPSQIAALASKSVAVDDTHHLGLDGSFEGDGIAACAGSSQTQRSSVPATKPTNGEGTTITISTPIQVV